MNEGHQIHERETSSSPDRPLVLIVDDERFFRETFRDVFENKGWRVLEACSGQEALGLFERQHLDLVIIDLVMPGMDGFETCAALRTMEGGEYVPILAVTGLQDTASIDRALEAGASDFISKPVNERLLEYRARFLLRSGRTLEKLVKNESKLKLLKTAVDSLPTGITISDSEGKIVYTNPAEAAMHGFSVEELLSRESNLLAPQRLRQERFVENLDQLQAWRRESVNRRKDGGEFPVQLSSVAVRGEKGDFLGIVTTCEDITERKRNEAQIHRLAYFDTLTGLPNRSLFLNRLQKALVTADRTEKSVAILFLDLDNFKDVNDTLGHDFGDKLLMAVARRFSSCIRGTDTLARLGGDEFVVMLSADCQETAGSTALRILEAFRRPLEVDGKKTFASFSIGIALYPEDAGDLEELLRCADIAMYQAKAQGRQKFRYFSSWMNTQIVERVTMETDLSHALEREDLAVVYQPQWDLTTGRCCGSEVLLRWRHPELGDLSPAKFIPLAESSGQIIRLGEWVLRAACTQASAWFEKGYPVERIAVNVSGHQLRQPDFVNMLERILYETNLDPARLELEFTEGVLMDYVQNTAGVLQSLKKMGIQLTIDDFGTGYSSLSYLKRFPIDRIKIDRNFISGIGTDRVDEAIVAAVVSLARTLDVRVLAEGVETLGQLEFLQSQGCSEVQGYYLGSPVPSSDLIRTLEQAAGPLASLRSA